MIIAKDCVVSFDYTLKDKNGEILDTSDGQDPLSYLHGFQNIIPGLEKELEGKKVGDEFNAEITPEDGYGARHDQLVTEVPKSELAEIPDLEVGLQLQAETPEGMQVFTVAAIEGDVVKLDGNHPLAGETLFFSVKVVEIRPASAEEISHGHVHGPGGHQH